MKKSVGVWSVSVVVDDIPDAGLHLAIEAPPAVRANVAELADVRELPRLSAIFDLTRHGAGVHVTGQVKADVGQICVVTLEPIDNSIEEAVDLKFTPTAGGAEPALKAARKRAQSKDEPPEPLIDGMLDLGALATEFLILGIDPYPRKSGAQFAAPKAEDAGEHPFAVLEALTKRPGGRKP
jgi:uncharacterized metal-binding protein YceD (DUF177 family)